MRGRSVAMGASARGRMALGVVALAVACGSEGGGEGESAGTRPVGRHVDRDAVPGLPGGRPGGPGGPGGSFASGAGSRGPGGRVDLTEQAASVGLKCEPKTSTDGVRYRLCPGFIPSFDGVPLDVDVTIPADAVGPRPLIVLAHGLGGAKTEWESTAKASADPDKDQYNNVSFVARGYAVLTYSARGGHASCGYTAPASGPGSPCATGWTHLADRRFEIRDLKVMAGILADAQIADPEHVGVSGGSYGGGQSWLAAIEGDQVTVMEPGEPEKVRLVPWRSPRGLRMHLAVAVSKYPWTDLVGSLVPNGRTSDRPAPDGDHLRPIGVAKTSYIGALFGLDATTNQLAPPGVDPSADLTAWLGAIAAGEPYAINPVANEAVRQLATWRSPFHQDALIAQHVAQHTEVPVLDIQGWTDHLFPALEGSSFLQKLKAADPSWPVSLVLADVGHPIAQNKAADWTWLNRLGNAFLDHHLLEGPEPRVPAVAARVTTCDGTVGTTYEAPTWAELATRHVTLTSSSPRITTSLPTDVANGAGTDPVARSRVPGLAGCITLPASVPSVGGASWEFQLGSPVTLVGSPAVHLELNVQGVDATVIGRLWDIAPDGSRTLVTRGVYRHQGSAGPAVIDFQLQGNAWKFAVGHGIRMEITQGDVPYLRHDNLPSTLTVSRMGLSLPAR